MLLLLKCPKCGHEQKMRPIKAVDLYKKRKMCVYCGKGFGLKDHIVKRLE